MNEQLMRAYENAMRDFEKEPLVFTARSGEQGTGEYFDQKWKAEHTPSEENNVIAFPTQPTQPANPPQTEELPRLIAGA